MTDRGPGPRHGRSASAAYSIASGTTAVPESRPTSPSSSTSTVGEDGDLDANKDLSKDGDSSDNDSLYHVNLSAIEQAAEVTAADEEQNARKKKQVATWSSLPRKGQLALLTISRLSEPLTQTSLQSYMWYMLKNFDPSLPDSAISSQVGMMQAAFTITQFLTAIAWGRAADSERFGRKKVLMIGLMGTMISALGFGFSKSFVVAMCFRSLGGALNGNVGVMRTVRFPFDSLRFWLTPCR
jgi:Major Facilitator Superfamily